jgi:hypothetical protein
MLFGLLLASAGFAAAAIGSHGKLLRMLTGTSSTSFTQTATTAGQRGVTLCHRTHSWKHPSHTITVSQNAVAAHVRHGDSLGQCAAGPVTTSPTTTSSDESGQQDDDQGNSGHDDDQGNPGHNHGNSGHGGSDNSGQSASAHGHDD